MSSFSEGELMLMTVHVSMPVSKYVCEHHCYNRASFSLLMWGAVFTACAYFSLYIKGETHYNKGETCLWQPIPS